MLTISIKEITRMPAIIAKNKRILSKKFENFFMDIVHPLQCPLIGTGWTRRIETVPGRLDSSRLKRMEHSCQATWSASFLFF